MGIDTGWFDRLAHRILLYPNESNDRWFYSREERCCGFFVGGFCTGLVVLFGGPGPRRCSFAAL
jgi:hypothetical protein